MLRHKNAKKKKSQRPKATESGLNWKGNSQQGGPSFYYKTRLCIPER